MLLNPFTSRREFLAGAVSALATASVSAQDADLTGLSILDASALIRAGRLSPVDLTRAYLGRIERLNERINAYITVTPGLALEQAESLTMERNSGRWRGPLHGIPIALKDNIDTAGIATTAASALFADRVPTEDAEVYRRLKAAGAVLLGKLNMHEFAYGGTSAITHYGPVHNPWNLDYIPGGSSGGSAAAVAARLCAAALGTDTLASIRLPAAYCGVVGLKATHGLASIRGIVPVSESLDHVGPLARSVGDAAAVMAALAGFDPRDPVSIEADLPEPLLALNHRVSALRVGLPEGFYFERLDSDIERSTLAAIDVIRRLTGGTREVNLPEAPDFSVLLAEAYQYHEEYLANPANHSLYHPATLERIVAAGSFSSADYIEGRRRLELARRAIPGVFEEVDLIVTPTVPVMPTPIDNAETPDIATGAESTVRNTAPFNLFGIPTINLPCGHSRNGLPIGIQISGPALGELSVLALAHAYEQATEWHLQRPPIG
jgi:aspartyl-tRNA(Asn)/glutamyl-tRNA(Gln) amidotransferase subunit A